MFYECPDCHHRWRGRGRTPGGEIHCPRCGKLAYTYAKAVRPMTYSCPTCGAVFPSEVTLAAHRAEIEKMGGVDEAGESYIKPLEGERGKMIREPTDGEIDEFDRLVPKAYQLHELTWCVKRQRAIITKDLRGEECLRCEHDLLQSGICDPL